MFNVGDWVVYLPHTLSEQYGVVFGMEPCNHSQQLYPIAYFSTNQIRFISEDFAEVILRRDVPADIAESLFQKVLPILHHREMTQKELRKKRSYRSAAQRTYHLRKHRRG